MNVLAETPRTIGIFFQEDVRLHAEFTSGVPKNLVIKLWLFTHTVING